MKPQSTLAALLTFLSSTIALAQDQPIADERDFSFLVPGASTLSDVIARWGTGTLEGDLEWDSTLRYFNAYPAEVYLEYPDIWLGNNYCAAHHLG